jgi:hypothetical protein
MEESACSDVLSEDRLDRAGSPSIGQLAGWDASVVSMPSRAGENGRDGGQRGHAPTFFLERNNRRRAVLLGCYDVGFGAVAGIRAGPFGKRTAVIQEPSKRTRRPAQGC